MLDFNILLEKIGGFGRSQLLIGLWIFYVKLWAGYMGLSSVFTGYNPDKRCNVPPLDNQTAYPNLTESDILNFTTPFDEANRNYDTCSRYGYDLSTCDGSLSCVNTSYGSIPCDQGFHYATDVMRETVVTEYNLVCDRTYINSISTSVYYVGMLLGSFIFGIVADNFGRQKTIVLSQIIFIACVLGNSFAVSVEMYIVFRMGIAIGHYGTTIGTFVYLMEISTDEYRTFFNALYNTGYVFGYMLLSGVAYQWNHWREILWICAVVSAPFLISSFFVPESPRWLFAKNKEKQGQKVTNLMARMNGVELTTKDWERARIQAEDNEKKNSNKSNEKPMTTIDLFKLPRMRLLTFELMFNWFSCSFVYYGISLNAGSLAGDIFVNNTLNGVMEFFAYFILIPTLDRFGRRFMITVSHLLAGVGLIVSVIINLYANDNQAWITVGLVFGFLAKFGISCAFGIVYQMTNELFPTSLRSNGMGVCSMASRIGGILAPFVIDLQQVIIWLPNSLFGALGIITGLASLFLPETNGIKMSDSAADAEEFYRNWRRIQNERLREKKIKTISEEVNGSFVAEEDSVPSPQIMKSRI